MGEALDDGRDDRAGFLVVARGHERQDRAGHRQRPHAAGARPLVAVEAVRVVVGGWRENDGAPVADRLDRELGAADLLLDEHRVRSAALGEQLAGVAARLAVVCQMRPHHLDPLAAGEARGLDRHRSLAEGGECLLELRLGADDPQAGSRLRRDLAEQLAREGLVPLDLGARARRPYRLRALREERVDDARRERLVGADHRDVHAALSGEGRYRLRIAHITQRVAAAGGLGVAHDRRVGMAEEGVQLTVLGHAHGERALAPPVSDDHRPHATSSLALSTPKMYSRPLAYTRGCPVMSAPLADSQSRRATAPPRPPAR